MKTVGKKALAFLLSLSLVMSGTVPAFAAEENASTAEETIMSELPEESAEADTSEDLTDDSGENTVPEESVEETEASNEGTSESSAEEYQETDETQESVEPGTEDETAVEENEETVDEIGDLSEAGITGNTAEIAAEVEPVHVLTWEEFRDQNTSDYASLSKSEKVDLMDAYEAYRQEMRRTAEGEYIEGATSGSISNSYIDVRVGSDGRYSIGNVEGNPNYDSDDNEKLLYGYPSTRTSTTLININGESRVFTADTITYSGNQSVATMTIGDITVKQILSLVSSDSSSIQDSVRIEYKVINAGSSSANVGVRIMLDTMLADNDDAPFKIKGTGNVTTIKNYDSATGIPDSYQVYDNLDNPTTIATGYLVRSGERKPDRVQFTNWRGISQDYWSYVGSEGSSLGDSAVGIYWDPTSLGVGKSMTVATYYGVGLGVSMGSTSNQNTTISSKEVGVYVTDNRTGDKLEGAEVTLTAEDGTSHTGTTDSNGFVKLEWDYTTKEKATIKATATDYREYTASREIKGGARIAITMKSVNDNTPMINSVTLDGVDVMNGTVHYIDNSGSHIDRAKPENVKTIKMEVKSDMPNCVYYLTQDGKTIAKNTTGVFEFKTTKIKNGTVIEKFSSGTVRKVYCVAEDGTVSQKINLGIKVSIPTVAVSTISDLNLWPYGGTNLGTGTLGALLLGDTIGFGLKNGAKLKVEVGEDGKVKISYNLDHMPNAQTQYKIEQAKEEFERTSKLKRSAKDIFGGALADGDKTAKMGVPFNLSFEYGGYGEGIIEDGSVNVDVVIFGTAKVEGSYTVNFFFTVPLYVTVGAGGSIGVKVTGSAYIATDGGRLGLNLRGSFNPQVYVSVEGGVGSKGIANLGVEGKGTLSYTFDLHPIHHLATLTGEANLKAEFLIFEKSLNLAKATVKLYDSEDRNGESYDQRNLYEELDEMPFKLKSRDYMLNESPVGAEEDGEFVINSGNVSAYASPVTVNAGDKKYRFWVDENMDRSVANGTMLVYSVYEDGAWSDARPVDDDGTADFFAKAVYDENGHIYVVWENSNKVFDDSTVTVDEVGNAQEICVKVLDTATGEFSDTTALTSNSVIDAIPAVTAYNGTAYIVWNRINGSALDDSSENFICYTSFANGSAGEEHSKSCGVLSVSEISAMSSGSGPSAVYTIFDSAEGINAQQKTYTLSMSTEGAQEVAIGGTEAVTVAGAKSATINGRSALLWMEDGNIQYRFDDSEEVQSVFANSTQKMEGFTVADGGSRTYLVWRSSYVTGDAQEGVVPESTAAIYAVCYEDGVWGNPYLLTDCSCDLVQNISAEVNEDGVLHLNYIEINYDDEGNISSSTMIDRDIEDRADVSLVSFNYDENEAVSGENLPITATVRNEGTTTLSNVQVTISGDSTSYERTFTELSMKPGDTRELVLDDFTVSENVGDGTLYNYNANVTTDGDSSDNGAQEFTLGYTCLIAEQEESVVNAGQIYYPVKISNISKVNAQQVNIKMLADSEDGSIIYDTTIDTIEAGDATYVYVPADELENSSQFFAYVTSSTPLHFDGNSVYTRMVCSNETIQVLSEVNVNISAGEGGKVTQGESGKYVSSQQIELTAEAEEGYVFAGWEADDGSFVDATLESTIYYVPENDAAVTARFVKQEEITSLSLSETTLSLKLGKSATLKALSGEEVNWSLIDWTSSDESVATVSRTGKVTALKEGTATIQAALKSNESVKATCELTVEPAEITSLRMVYPRITLAGPGEEKQLKVDLVTDPEDSLAQLVWESEDPSIATVDENGVVRAVADGTTRVTVRAATDDSISSSSVVSVVTPIEDIAFSVDEIVINTGDEPFTFTASTVPDHALRANSFTWTLEDESLASMETQGEHNEKVTLTALNPGTTLITAAIGDAEKTMRITVLSPARDITLSETELSIRMTDVANLTAEVTPSNTTDPLVWSSSDSTIASVSNGTIRTYAPGTVTITAQAGSVTKTCQVTVYEVPATGISLSQTEYTLTKGESYRLTAELTPSNTTDAVSWTSSNSGIASVSGGTVYANKVGTATITATCGDFSAECIVTVQQKQYETITVDGIEGFESQYTDASTHYYSNSINKVWKLTTGEGITGVKITFDENTKLENGYDYLQVLDKDGEPVSFTRSNGSTAEKVTGSDYKNETITIKTFPVRILMHTDGSAVDYGFKVNKIEYICNLSKAVVKTASASYAYTGKAISPAVTVTVGGKTLKKGTDYTVQLSNNKNIGTATVKVVAAGENTGSASTKFKIVPKKVTGLKQTTTALTSVKLTWTKQTGITGYKVYKYANSKYTLVKTIAKAATNTYTISGLKAGTTYTYVVTAYKKVGSVIYESAKGSIKIATLPKAPTLTGKAGTKSVVLTWKKITGATGYVVYMSTSKSGSYKKVSTITKAATVKATIKNLTSKKKYYFKIKAYTKAATKTVYSADSKIIAVTAK